MSVSQHQPQDHMDEAIAWHARLASEDVSERDLTDFSVWLDTCAENRKAYDSVCAFDMSLQDSVESFAGEREDHLRRTVHPLTGRRSVRLTIAAAGAALAAASLALYIAGPFQTGSNFATAYATRIGEQKVINLEDGSKVELAAASRLTFSQDNAERHAALEQGEALFHVAKDKDHPFIVAVGNLAVRVVGTVFDIHSSTDGASVAVLEGHVQVGPRNNIDSGVPLARGDKLTYSKARGTVVLSRIDPAKAAAWREGYLVYDNAPLSQVVADLNRYFANPIVLGDDSLSTLKFSGVLRVDHEQTVLVRLQEFLPLTATKGADGRILLQGSKRRD